MALAVERGINYETLVNIALPIPQLGPQVHMSIEGRHGEVRVGWATFSAKHITTDHNLFLGNTFLMRQVTCIRLSLKISLQDNLFSNLILKFFYKITFSDKITSSHLHF